METPFYMFEGDKDDWQIEQKSVLHKQPFFAIDLFSLFGTSLLFHVQF